MKINNDVDVYVIYQCCLIIQFCCFIPTSDKNKNNQLPVLMLVLKCFLLHTMDLFCHKFNPDTTRNSPKRS